jgi:hypothetical protein
MSDPAVRAGRSFATESIAVRRLLLLALPWVLAALFLFTTIELLLHRKPARAAVSVDSAPVVMAMKKIARLATVEVQVSDVVKYEEFKSFLFMSFPKSATLRVRGSVLGGFDLQRDGVSVVAHPETRKVEIRMPRPAILAVDPKLEWFDEKSGMFNPITPADRNRWMAWARTSLARTARQAGMDDRAKEQARKLLAGAAEALGWTADVEFPGGPPAPLP